MISGMFTEYKQNSVREHSKICTITQQWGAVLTITCGSELERLVEGVAFAFVCSVLI